MASSSAPDDPIQGSEAPLQSEQHPVRPHSTPIKGKRRNDDRDPDELDSQDQELMPPSPDRSKKQRRLSWSSEDEDNEEPAAPLYLRQVQHMDAQNGEIHMAGGSRIDESFYELCRSFAQIELPQGHDDEDLQEEKCPLCPQVFPRETFATHVYMCLRQLDEVEQKHQTQLDEKYAELLQHRELPLPRGKLFEEAQRDAFEKFKPEMFCPDGANCVRHDAQHFISKKHPRVSCPMCSDEFEVYAINAHVSLCIDAEPLEDSVNVRSRPPQQGMADDSDSKDQMGEVAAGGGGDDDDDEGDQLMRSPSGLTTAQMKAMAGMVVQQKNLPAAKQDVSLHKLLETFASLGFTKDALSNELSRSRSVANRSPDPADDSDRQPPQ